jgi:hypothetical protein
MLHERVRKTGRALRWYALRDAAQILAVSPAALRKQLERRARRVADEAVEASIDGVRGRKFANRLTDRSGNSACQALGAPAPTCAAVTRARGESSQDLPFFGSRA